LGMWERNPPVTALPCQGPLGKRVMGEEGTDCHDQFANWSRNDTFLRSAVGADVGSELSAASGRSSEVSEWPRSKFPASAVRQRKNFGHRNRVIGPYGGVTRSAIQVWAAGWGHPGLRRELGWAFSV